MLKQALKEWTPFNHLKGIVTFHMSMIPEIYSQNHRNTKRLEKAIYLLTQSNTRWKRDRYEGSPAWPEMANLVLALLATMRTHR